MRPWLLLVSLLVSDLSPLGDGDWVVENYSWSLCRKLLLNGQMSPLGLEILQTQTVHHCTCSQRNCVHVAVQHKQRTSPFYWVYTVHDDHGWSLSHREFTGIIHRNHIPALVVSRTHGEGKSVPAFLVKSTLPALHVISENTPTKAGGETSHIAMDIRKDRPDSGSAWLLHHHTAASGRNFQAFLLKKSKSWAPATIVQLQKMLTERYSTVIISCCFKEGEIRSAMNIKKISKEQIAKPQIRQKESTRRAMDIKVLTEYDGQRPSKALVSRRDIFQAATLHSGSSSVKTSDMSQLEIQRNAVRIIKKNEHLNLDEGSLLQKSVQRQHSLKAASSVYDDDGFYVERQLLLVSRDKTESINRPQYNIRATQDDNKEDFSGKIKTKQAALRRPEGESETEQSHTNTRRLAYILRADFTHKTDDNDVDHKQMLTEVREEVLIMLLLPDTERETQTEPSSEKKLILNTDTGWKTTNQPIKELGDPPPMTKVIKENFIIEPHNSKCKCLKESQFSLEMHALDRTERMDIKPAESTAKVTTVSAYTEGQFKETTEKIEHTETNNTPHENTSINHTKQEENVPSEESVIPSPPSLEMMETETAKTERTPETTTVNMELKETTSSTEVFNQGSTQKTVLPSTEETPATTMSPESETDTEPRFTTKTGNIQATIEKSFSGLRMREDIPADANKLNEERAATNRPETERKEDQNDPKVNSFTSAKPLQTTHQQATDKLPKTTDDSMPLCRGLIHRTEAGWKHCVERFAGLGSKMFSSREPTDAFKDTGEREKERASFRDHKDSLLNDDEYDHFYYFDGVLRRVQNNFYPYYKRQRRRKRSHDNTEDSVLTVRKRGDTRENLLSYIQRLTLKNKASHFK